MIMNSSIYGCSADLLKSRELSNMAFILRKILAFLHVESVEIQSFKNSSQISVGRDLSISFKQESQQIILLS